MKSRISLSIDEELLRRIDTIRGMTPRSTLIEALLRVTLRDYLSLNPIFSSKMEQRWI